MRGEMLKGHLDLLLLAVLDGSPAHGYAVAERLRERSQGRFDLPEGTLYPALHRLEHAALLVSRWAEQNGRRRRIYELTLKGERMLAQQQRDWWEFARAVHAAVEVPDAV
jgi:PadR family transcriptional regulator PadR